jgi:NADPH:quinone reductase-like Zn-dependent oxidoreductase
MKAIVQDRYGSADVLQLRDVDRPVPGDGQVLLRVHAASVNALDWHLLRAKPGIVRMGRGLRRPKEPIRGVDVAGTVESVGKGATRWNVGDAVFGTAAGSFAEYVVAAEGAVTRKPSSVSFDQAAAVPIAAFTALEGMRDKAAVKPGQRVLINGAGGGVGTFAIQIAKWMGAHVTATTSPANLELVRSVGADEVIDYTREDFTRSGRMFDVIFDLGSNRSLTASRRVLNPGGIYLMVGARPTMGTFGFLGRMLKVRVLSGIAKKRMGAYMARGKDEDLVVLSQLLESGKLVPVIDRRYPLEQVPEAIRYLETARARGKVVISVLAP